MSPLLVAQRLNLRVATRTLCADLDLALRPGERWALLGVNGAGKTTLLHTLAGLRAPAGGEVLIDGAPLTARRRRAIARQIGLLPQETTDPFPATVLETALLGRAPFLAPWARESAADERRARAALEVMELAECAERSVATLSGGERRRLAFALLLVQAPAIWLLDEPTNHLDLRHQALALQQVRAACDAGATAVMSLHDPNLAAHHASHALLLHGNGSWETGSVEEMLTAERLSRLYGHPIREALLEGRRIFVPQ